MGQFSRDDRKAADKRVTETRQAYEAAVKKWAKKNPGRISRQGREEINAAKDRYTMALSLRKRVHRSGPGPDAYRGGGPQSGLGPPGPRDQ